MSNEFASNEMSSMPPGRTSEREYLLEQQALADLALRQMATVISRDLVQCADPAVWVRKYPLRSVATAFSLGFAITRANGADDGVDDDSADRNGSAGGRRGKKQSRSAARRKCTLTRRALRIAGKLLRSVIVGPVPFVH